jgi:hypothetical protein
VTFLLEKRKYDTPKGANTGTSLDDAAELRLLSALVRDNARCLTDVAEGIYPGGYFLWQRGPATGRRSGDESRGNAWAGVTAQLQGLVQLKQVMNLHHLASLESGTSPAGHQSMKHTRLRLTSTPSLKRLPQANAQQNQDALEVAHPPNHPQRNGRCAQSLGNKWNEHVPSYEKGAAGVRGA